MVQMTVKSFYSDDEKKLADKINEYLSGDNFGGKRVEIKDIKFNTIYINRPSVEDSGVLFYAWVMWE